MRDVRPWVPLMRGRRARRSGVPPSDERPSCATLWRASLRREALVPTAQACLPVIEALVAEARA